MTAIDPGHVSHVIFRLQPFHANINKRLVKSPKLYFCDAGLACRLIGIQNPQMLEIHPLRGALFENLVFSELVKRTLSSGVRPDIHFLQDKTGHEVDLLPAQNGRFLAFEAKSGATFRSDYLNDIRFFRNLLGEQLTDAYILYAGDDESRLDGVHILNAIRYFTEEK